MTKIASKTPLCHLILPAKRRGGVGASEMIRLIADALIAAGQPVLGLDLDESKPDFSSTWPDCVRLFPLKNEEQLLAVLKAAPGQPGEVRLVDIPAEVWPRMRQEIGGTRWLDFLSKRGSRLCLLIFATGSEADARDVIETLHLVQDRDVSLVLVHNRAFVGPETPALFRPIQAEIMRRGGAEIIVPALHSSVRDDVQRRQGKHRLGEGRYLAPAELPPHLDFLGGALFETWLAECRGAIAGAADHLFPTPIAEEVRAKFSSAAAPASTTKPALFPDFDQD